MSLGNFLLQLGIPIVFRKVSIIEYTTDVPEKGPKYFALSAILDLVQTILGYVSAVILIYGYDFASFSLIL